MYTLKDSIVLTSGREVPQHLESRNRSEGVAIVPSESAIHAWKVSGRCQKAWSSRLITASLKLGVDVTNCT